MHTLFLFDNDLALRWRNRGSFVILETDFCTAAHFLATWVAWRDDPHRPVKLHYLAQLQHPINAADLITAALPNLAEQLRAAWSPCVPGMQRLLLDEGQLVLDLLFAADSASLAQFDARVDAFYLDASRFNPKNAKILARLAAPEASLHLLQGDAGLKTALQTAGFVWPPAAATHPQGLACASYQTRHPPPAAKRAERHAIIIGAGLAGAAACERLAARGWRIDLIESHPEAAAQASGNLAGIFMPTVSLDDNRASRLTRAAYLFSLQQWQRLGGIGSIGTLGTLLPGEHCGVLQLARDASHAQAQAAIAARWRYPPQFAQWLESEAASALLGSHAPHGGWLFANGGWAHPPSICQALLAACGGQLQTHFNQQADHLVHDGGLWQVRDSQQRCIAQAPVVIIANGGGAASLAQSAALPLSQIRGQVTYLAQAALPPLNLVVCGEAYITRPWQGQCSVGASYDQCRETGLSHASQDENLQHLRQTLPLAGRLLETQGEIPLAGRVGFRCVSPDRLPLVGALPDYAAASAMRIERLRDVPRWPNVYGLLGYASRGLIWSALAAELLAAQLEGEPLPLERELAAALDPARFLLKNCRRPTH